MVSNYGLLAEGPGKLVGTELEVYEPGEGEVLIRNESIAQNPVDWKSVEYNVLIPKLPAVVGVDTAGVVEKVGPGVSNLKPGDRVLTMTRIAQNSRFGTYQRYSIGKAFSTLKLPEAYSFDEGATIPLGYYTAAVGLFCDLGLPVPQMASGGLGGAQTQQGKPILVWGAASSVGMYAVQLAALAGYKVIATASKKNWELVKGLGAAEVIDYKDPEVVEKIKKAAPDLELIYDAVSENGSCEAGVKALANGGEIVTTLPFRNAPANVKVHEVFAAVIYQDPEKAKVVNDLLERLLQAGKLRPNPVKVMPNGLKSVEEGWKLMRDGKVSGQKLIYHPQE